MLHLLYGPAASGKTDLLMGRIRTAVAARTPGQVLLVPEQYSHEAERALCAACGDSLSLYAEVLSFTGLARRVAAETGAGEAPLLDQGGRLLCMALALGQVAPRLRLFGAAAHRPQMQQTLLGAVDELKTACVTPDALEKTAARCPGYLGDKLRDLALVLAAYDAVTAQGHADPTDRLTRLAERIPASALGRTGHFYLDGFTDYTRQELAVVRALLAAGADVTVCLTLDALSGGSEIFGAARRTARVLLDMADDCGVQATVEACPARAADTPLRVLEQQLFSYTSAHFDDPAQTITVYTADDLAAECAWAAARALQLVQSGCRWRDIAIAVRGFSDYAPALERMCAYYGVPLYFARRTDLLQKPLVALIRAAYDIVTGGWDAEDVSAYLRTGLAGLMPEETDTLENYVLLWSIRGSAWTRPAPWQQHPDGYGAPDTDESAARLAEINDLRQRAAGPLRLLGAESSAAATAEAQAMALADFLERLHLAQRLDALAESLRAEGLSFTGLARRARGRVCPALGADGRRARAVCRHPRRHGDGRRHVRDAVFAHARLLRHRHDPRRARPRDRRRPRPHAPPRHPAPDRARRVGRPAAARRRAGRRVFARGAARAAGAGARHRRRHGRRALARV